MKMLLNHLQFVIMLSSKSRDDLTRLNSTCFFRRLACSPQIGNDTSIRAKAKSLKVILREQQTKNEKLREELSKVSQQQASIKELVKQQLNQKNLSLSKGWIQNSLKTRSKNLKEQIKSLRKQRQRLLSLQQSRQLSQLRIHLAQLQQFQSLLQNKKVDFRNFKTIILQLQQLALQNQQLQKQLNSYRSNKVIEQLSKNMRSSIEIDSELKAQDPIHDESKKNSTDQLINNAMVIIKQAQFSKFRKKSEQIKLKKQLILQAIKKTRELSEDSSLERSQMFFTIGKLFKSIFQYNPFHSIKQDFPDRNLTLSGTNLIDNKIPIIKNFSVSFKRDIHKLLNLKASIFHFQTPKELVQNMFRNFRTVVTMDQLLAILAGSPLSLDLKTRSDLAHFLVNDQFSYYTQFSLFSLHKIESQLIYMMGRPLLLAESEQVQMCNQFRTMLRRYNNMLMKYCQDHGKHLLNQAELLQAFRIIHQIQPRQFSYLVLCLYQSSKVFQQYQVARLWDMFVERPVVQHISWRKDFFKHY